MAKMKQRYEGNAGKKENNCSMPEKFLIPAFFMDGNNDGIVNRARQSWVLLTHDEKDEYFRETESIQDTGFELFIREYLMLSGVKINSIIKPAERLPN